MQVAVDYLGSCAALSQGSIGAMSIDISVPPNTGGILPLSGACDFRHHVVFLSPATLYSVWQTLANAALHPKEAGATNA